MIHAISTHLLVNHRLTTAALERIWESGFPLVEIFCARQHFDYRNAAQVNEVKHWFRDSELKLHSLHAPMYSDDCWGRSGPHAVISITETEKLRRKASVDEIKRALEVAESVPFRYLIQHVGTGGEEYDDAKLEAAFCSLEELKVFASHRGVEVLLENIPNRLSTAERLMLLLGQTHMDLHFCFDTGHAHITGNMNREFSIMADRIRSTHIHDNDGQHDGHLFPLLASEGSVDWKQTMDLLRSRPDQYPLLMELREMEGMEQPLRSAKECAGRLEHIG